MGWCNEFVAAVDCPHCQQSVAPAFQISVGSGDFFIYNVGDDIFNESHNPRGAIRLRPSSIASFLKQYTANFCAIGLGDCPQCSSDIWATVRFENQRLDSAQSLPQSPENMYAIWAIES